MKEQDLREKFEDVEKMTFHNHLTVKTSTDQCVQIAKDYAEQEAIEFLEWSNENYFNLPTYEKMKTLKQLYQLFKNRENER